MYIDFWPEACSLRPEASFILPKCRIRVEAEKNVEIQARLSTSATARSMPTNTSESRASSNM